MRKLGAHAGTAGLDGLNFGIGPGKAVETRGQLVTVEEFTLLGSDGA